MADIKAGIAPQIDTHANWVTLNPTLGKNDSGKSYGQIIFSTASPVGDIIIWGNDQTYNTAYATGQYYLPRDYFGTAAAESVGSFLETSDYPSDSVWTTTTTLLNGWTGTVSYIKRAGFVTVIFTTSIDGSSKTDNTVLTLPAAYRPLVLVSFAGHQSTGATANCFVAASGDVDCSGTAAFISGSVTYPVL